MALPEENQAVIQSIVTNTIDIENLSPTQRKKIENAIHPTIDGFRVWKKESPTTYTGWEIGDQVLNIDNTGKRQVLGMVIALPFDPNTDLDDAAKFDLYQDNEPS